MGVILCCTKGNKQESVVTTDLYCGNYTTDKKPSKREKLDLGENLNPS